MVANRPLHVGGPVVGAARSWFGVVNVAGLRRELQDRFSRRLPPAVREALVGEGLGHGGEKVPSLRSQLQRQVRERADAARAALGEEA